MHSSVEAPGTIVAGARAGAAGSERARSPTGGAAGGAGGAAGGAGSRVRAMRRVRRIALIAAALALIPGAISYVQMLGEPSNSSLGIRTVEWLRSNGGAGLVSRIENLYYTLTAPSKGGPRLRALPHVGVAGGLAGAPGRGRSLASGQGAVERPYAPPRIAPLTSPALSGEGVWHATRRGSAPYPPLLVTTFRSDPAEYPRLVAGVAWIDPRRTKIELYPGTLEPSVSIPARGPAEVPPSLRGRLLATFNAGFKYEDARGGFALDGHTYAPLREEQATLLQRTDGTVSLDAWRGGPTVGGDVAFATQNLPLIVEEGRPSPKLNDSTEWGATLGNAIQVWRSGIGIDRHGDLIYAQADDQTVASLAQILIHAGAVRAMELDINSYWVSFNTYGAPGALDPTKLLAETERPAERYLSPDERDFFAVYEH